MKMIISPQYNFVFMKVNKTATSSIELFLAENIEEAAIVTPINPGGKSLYEGRNIPTINGKPIFQNHESFGEIKKIIGYPNIDFFNSARKIACVRNPWALMATTFEWRKLKKDNRALDNSFKTWLYGNFDLSMYRVPHVMSSIFNQDGISRYYKKENKDNTSIPIADTIIKFENVENNFRDVCKTIGIKNTDFKLKKTASSDRKKHYSFYYDDETIELVYNNFKPVIDYFNYQFNKEEHFNA